MSDALTLTSRCLRLSRRQLDALITALVLPVLLMVLFVELFGGAIRTGGHYVTYVVPGVLVLCAGFSSGLTAVAVCQDLRSGMADRLRSMDVPIGIVLAGHVAASVVRNLASGALVLAVAVGLGFHPHADVAQWLAAVGILGAFVLAVSWLSAAVGVAAASLEAANGATFLFMFLPYASSAFVPVHTMPSWLRGFAAHQPVTPITDTLRHLLAGGAAGGASWTGLAWCAAIVAASVLGTAVLVARRDS